MASLSFAVDCGVCSIEECAVQWTVQYRGVCSTVDCAGGSLHFTYSLVQCAVQCGVQFVMQYVLQCSAVCCSVKYKV